MKAVSELEPDLVFLDVQMPKLDGFEVLELIGREVAVVFVTAYDEYALRAFEVHAVDYLLKPFSAERLGEAVEQARRRLAERAALPIGALVASARPAASPDSSASWFATALGSHVIPVARLDYVEAQDDYVCLHAEGKRLLKEQTMAELRSGASTRLASCASTAPTSSTSSASLASSHTAGTAAWRSSPTARALPVSRAGYARLRELS